MVADALECVDDERPKLLVVQVNGYLRGAAFWPGRPEVCDRHSGGERSGEFQIERGVAHGDCDVGQRARRHKRDLTGFVRHDRVDVTHGAISSVRQEGDLRAPRQRWGNIGGTDGRSL